MGNIKRLYVEKKAGCDVEAQHLLEDLKENLAIENLISLRILHRYCNGGERMAKKRVWKKY